MFSSLNLPPVDDAASPEVPAPTRVPATRRGNPAYRQFSAYVPDDLYRRFKSKLALENRDLSEVMEQLIVGWLE